jgi:hypothetical protein
MPSMNRDQVVARLLRDGHGDLVTAIRDRVLTPYAAACLVGYRQRPPTKSIPGEHNRSRRRLAIEGALIWERK